MSFFRPPLCTSDYIDLFIHRSLIMLPPLVLLSLYVYVYLNRRRNLISTVVIVLLFHHTQCQYLSNIPSNKFYSSFFFFQNHKTYEDNWIWTSRDFGPQEVSKLPHRCLSHTMFELEFPATSFVLLTEFVWIYISHLPPSRVLVSIQFRYVVLKLEELSPRPWSRHLLAMFDSD